MSPNRSRLLVAALVLLLTSVAAGCGESTSEGGVEVIGARVDYPANPAVAAVRMEIVNDSDADDTLIAVSSPDADASVHRSTTSADGMASMNHITKLPIPAGETVEFAPGGLHVMLDEPDRNLEIGDEVELVLTFERTGEQSLTVPVVEPGATATDIEAGS